MRTTWGTALLLTLAATASADPLSELTRSTPAHTDASNLPLATMCDLSMQAQDDLGGDSTLVALDASGVHVDVSLCAPQTQSLPSLPGLAPEAQRMLPGLTPPAQRMLPGLTPQGERMLPPTGLPTLQPSKRVSGLELTDIAPVKTGASVFVAL